MTKYPFDRLQNETDAFDIPMAGVNAKTVAMSCYKAGQRLGRRFSYRAIPADGVYEVSLAPPEIPLTQKRPDAAQAGTTLAERYKKELDAAAARLRK